MLPGFLFHYSFAFGSLTIESGNHNWFGSLSTRHRILVSDVV